MQPYYNSFSLQSSLIGRSRHLLVDDGTNHYKNLNPWPIVTSLLLHSLLHHRSLHQLYPSILALAVSIKYYLLQYNPRPKTLTRWSNNSATVFINLDPLQELYALTSWLHTITNIIPNLYSCTYFTIVLYRFFCSTTLYRP